MIRGQLQQVVDRYVTPQLQEPGVPFKLELVGEIPTDSAVREAVQKRRLLMEMLPGCPAAQGISAAARSCSRERGRSAFELLGGEVAVRGIVDRFYDLDGPRAEYAALRGHGSTLDSARDKLFWFLCGWLGGPQHYTQRFGRDAAQAPPAVRHRHPANATSGWPA